jgi:hypothetical protein
VYIVIRRQSGTSVPNFFHRPSYCAQRSFVRNHQVGPLATNKESLFPFAVRLLPPAPLHHYYHSQSVTGMSARPQPARRRCYSRTSLVRPGFFCRNSLVRRLLLLLPESPSFALATSFICDLSVSWYHNRQHIAAA